MPLHIGLREFGAEEHEGVIENFAERPAGVQGRGGAAKGKHARDDGFELSNFIRDHLEVAAARVGGVEIKTEGAVEQFNHGEGIANFMRNFGGEQAERGQGFIFSEHFFRVKYPRVEAGVLQGNGGETGKGGGEALFVVIKTMSLIVENSEYAGG